MTTSTTRMTSNRKTSIRPLPRPVISGMCGSRRWDGGRGCRPRANLAIQLDQFVKVWVILGAAPETLNGVAAQLRNGVEGQLAIKKAIHGNVVGGNQRGARAGPL